MKKYKSFIIFLVLFASLFYFIPIRENEKCIWQREFEHLNIYGIVKNKFIDSSQHSTPIIEIENLKSNLIDTLDFFGDSSNSFNRISILDTIYKRKLSNEILVKKNGAFEVIGRVDFGCSIKKEE